MPSPIIAIGIRATNAAEEKRRPPGVGEQLAVGPQHGRTLRDRADGRARRGRRLRRSAGNERRHVAVRRLAAGVLRRPGGPGRRAAVPGERHARPRHPARAAARGRPSTTSASAASARSTRRTARWSRRCEADFAGARPRPAGLLGQPQLGARTSPTTLARDRRRRPRAGCSPCSPRPTPPTPAAASTARTSPPPSRRSATGRPQVDRIRHYFNHPGFVEADGRRAPWRRSTALPGRRARRRPAGLRHPLGPDRRWTTAAARTGGAYVAQHRDVARLVAAGVAAATGVDHDLDLVYCSRSGPPAPAVAGARRQRPPRGAASPTASPAAVLVPIGFVSDHMEVRYDLDTEALATARRLGLPVRAGRHGRHRPAVRRRGARAGARAGRRRARRGAGSAGALGELGPEPRRLPGRLLPQRARPAAARALRRRDRAAG